MTKALKLSTTSILFKYVSEILFYFTFSLLISNFFDSISALEQAEQNTDKNTINKSNVTFFIL